MVFGHLHQLLFQRKNLLVSGLPPFICPVNTAIGPHNRSSFFCLLNAATRVNGRRWCQRHATRAHGRRLCRRRRRRRRHPRDSHSFFFSLRFTFIQCKIHVVSDRGGGLLKIVSFQNRGTPCIHRTERLESPCRDPQKGHPYVRKPPYTWVWMYLP